jgi:hypothetical protein
MSRILRCTAIALLTIAVACGTDDDGADADPETTTDAGTATSPDAASSADGDTPGLDEGGPADHSGPVPAGDPDVRFWLDGLGFVGSTSCTVDTGEVPALEVSADVAPSVGDGRAELQLRDVPELTGDSYLHLTLAGRGEFRTPLAASGTTEGDVDDLLWEVEDGIFFLFGAVDLDDGTRIPVDVEMPCTTTGG